MATAVVETAVNFIVVGWSVDVCGCLYSLKIPEDDVEGRWRIRKGSVGAFTLGLLYFPLLPASPDKKASPHTSPL